MEKIFVRSIKYPSDFRGGGRWSPTVVDAANAINLDVYNAKDGYVHITSTDYTGY